MPEKPKTPKRDSLLIAISFLASGIVLFDVSVYLASQIICFIGLGLTFWGALFLLITPQKRVESSFLVASTLPSYMTIDRMLKDIKTKNEAYYLPSYAKDVNLPEYMKGLKEMVVFVPEENAIGMAAIEDLAKGKFLIENPKGLLITPPGISLLDKIEQKPNTNITKISIGELDETLSYLLSELDLAQEIKMKTNENGIILQINGSLYKNLYNQQYNLQSITLLGCPIVSAAACAVSKYVGKPITIQKIITSPDGKITTATLKIVEL